MNTVYDYNEILKLKQFYKKHLLENVLGFWEQLTVNIETGGYITAFDRKGNVIDYDKYTWLQARQTWTFANIYSEVERNQKWLKLAEHGRDFLIKHCYAGNGRWYFRLDGKNRVIDKTLSVFSDMFALSGLCEYAKASGNLNDKDLIQETFQKLYENVTREDFSDYYPYRTGVGVRIHGLYMLCINTLSVCLPVLDDNRAEILIRDFLDKIFQVFVNEEYKTVLETVQSDYLMIKTDEGMLLNPGHAFESMWFCLAEGERLSVSKYTKKACEVIGWILDKSEDKEYGGIYYMLDAFGKAPVFRDWDEKRNLRWDDKVWWTHCEAMVALLYAALVDNNQKYFNKFLQLHNYVLHYFFDSKYGEWYTVLNRDGSVRIDAKGGYMKSAYHLPRALAKIYSLLSKMPKEEKKHDFERTCNERP